jgi:hypothetical protein
VEASGAKGELVFQGFASDTTVPSCAGATIAWAHDERAPSLEEQPVGKQVGAGICP